MTTMLEDISSERWPGYAEQSWPERFAELDRRYGDLLAAYIRNITGALSHEFTD
jgi:hypothetical protein